MCSGPVQLTAKATWRFFSRPPAREFGFDSSTAVYVLIENADTPLWRRAAPRE
jgi:hypothetical protein